MTRADFVGVMTNAVAGLGLAPDAAMVTFPIEMFLPGSDIGPLDTRRQEVYDGLTRWRSAFDRVVQAGAFVSVNTGAAPDAHCTPVPKADADKAFDAAACIGCGACVAACKNASAMLFVGAKVSHFLHLPQGRVERERRVLNLVAAMDHEGFGNCTNQYECEAVCPKDIPVRVIAEMNREFTRAKVLEEPVRKSVGGHG